SHRERDPGARRHRLHVGGRRALAVQACPDRRRSARRRQAPARAARAGPRRPRRRRTASLSAGPMALPRNEDRSEIGPRARREALVREHMESENQHDFDATIATFAHPRYELIPTGETFDGEEEVRAYFAQSRAVFPDQRNELI